MHLLIDIRSVHPLEKNHVALADIWVELWQETHPEDRITWLIYSDETHSGETICVPRRSPVFWGKKLAAHAHGPDRIISFSLAPSIDPSLKTIQHISDIAEFLYPRRVMNWFEKKQLENRYKKVLKHAHRIVVPYFGAGRELAEVFGTSEEVMCVIPYPLPKKNTEHKDMSIRSRYGVVSDFFIVEGTPGEEWNPIGLLQAFGVYIRELWGEKQLIICGNLGENLGHISSCIRSLDLIPRVKIIGEIPESDRSALYQKASGWIAVGPYYSAGSRIVEAEMLGLPMILSDIPALHDYHGQKIHPNHMEELPKILKNPSKVEGNMPLRDNQSILQVYTKIVAE